MNDKPTHAVVVPLIGGIAIAAENVFGSKPDFALSYSPFAANDAQYLNYRSIPYQLLDEGGKHPHEVDVVSTTCPCAGLSSLSVQASSTNPANEWMLTTANYVLGEMKPKVFWGENAPRLASKMGEPVVKNLRAIARKNGYTMSIYQTKSILHGLSQVRDRTFYFFWKGDEIPVFDYFDRGDHTRIEDHIRSIEYDENDPMSALTNKNKPSDNPFYKYILEIIEDGATHKEFADKQEKTVCVLDYIERSGVKYKEVAIWMEANGYQREANRCIRMHDKLASGGNIMRKTTEIGKNFIGAFVGHMPTSLTHPDEDRYLTIREALSIMKLPEDFQLVGGRKNINMMCQNVPVTTAEDMARQIQKHLNRELDTITAEFLIQNNKKKSINVARAQASLEEFI
jgi:site-specific DNA-cytosine methylase